MKSLRDFKDGIGKIAGKGLIDNPDDILQRGTKYGMLTGIVRETISNPYEYLNRPYKINGTEYNGITHRHILSGRIKELPDGTNINTPIKNYYHVENMPMNSIFVQVVDNSRGRDGEKLIVCYPFFPPHLSLPVKPGEYVWLIKEDIKGADFYYWMCRKVGIIQVDDVNFTNMERTSIISEMYKNKADTGGAFVPDSETLEKMTSLGKSETSNIKQETYTSLLRNSYGYVNEFIGEAVPRVSKKAPDLLLQGSNNAGIHITTEKFVETFTTPLATNTEAEYLGQTPPNFNKIDAPAIDMFISRKKYSSYDAARSNSPDAIYNNINTITGIHTTRNISDGNPEIAYSEIDKVRDIVNSDNPKDIYNEELNDLNDATNVGSRLYMSNYCEFDSQFGSSFDILTEKFGPCIITYSQNNRMIAEENARISSKMGESFLDLDELGNIVLKSSKDNGQQFISMTPGNGNTRINARNNIYLTHGSDNDTPSLINSPEPYVLVSQLESILSVIFDTLNAHSNAIVGLVPLRMPPLIPAAAKLINMTLGTEAGQISVPTIKYGQGIPNPPISAPYIAKASSTIPATSILRSSRIIADNEKLT